MPIGQEAAVSQRRVTVGRRAMSCTYPSIILDNLYRFHAASR
jgi:hypothetical protein